jgi:hypothetical protein
MQLADGVVNFHAVNAASQSFHTGSYPSRRINSATSLAERSSAI